ncbi:MAG: glycosyltransferase [Burkholderiaceae bacterium]
MRLVLLIAYHFPPLSGSSGLQRTLRFAQYLPEFGWKPIVLTVLPSAYEQVDERSLVQIPPGCEVVRTRCFDAGRHLSVRGRYAAFTALPDRWASWQLWGVRAGERLCRERGIRALWSTYPIATAHKIGAALAERTALPWIADFRDPMAQDGYPSDPRRWREFKRIEESAASTAVRLVFVSPSALAMYRERYPETPAERFVLIENGFDEPSFEGLPDAGTPHRVGPPVLLHSGIVYPSERDPGALFEALGRLVASGRIRPGDVVVRFRASVHEDLLRRLASERRVEAFVEILPTIPYRDALREMKEADALLVMQGANCNEQIPAKLYEYLRAGRPILGLADPRGDTGRTLGNLGYPFVTSLESADAIADALPAFLQALRTGTLPVAGREVVDRYSRRALTGRFAGLLDAVSGT